ncbi:hypothetical protein SKAU_G00423100 [Synaphobranchus kaupii]|uniref:Uncharacterized protein n=1 Tax=Synaphobranchus kaupii TaxID=118154 RepID=A0A9Q1IAH0_SYNKA|nr:hypothetical protein SKAU_G00423100 [Synaphobranchus kaupii]
MFSYRTNGLAKKRLGAASDGNEERGIELQMMKDKNWATELARRVGQSLRIGLTLRHWFTQHALGHVAAGSCNVPPFPSGKSTDALSQRS